MGWHSILTDKEIIKKLFYILKPYKKDMIIIFICLLISILFNLCLPILNKDIMDKGFMNQDFKLLLILVMVMTILKLLNNILEF